MISIIFEFEQVKTLFFCQQLYATTAFIIYSANIDIFQPMVIKEKRLHRLNALAYPNILSVTDFTNENERKKARSVVAVENTLIMGIGVTEVR